MAAIHGDIRPRDEGMHALGPEGNFNESMYFNFFDARQGYGGFVRIGNRANERYAEVTACVYVPGGEVLFNYLRPDIAGNDAFEAGGMRFDVVQPLARHRTRYAGTAVRLAEPTEMADPRRAFTSNPHVPLVIDLDHEAVGPAYGSRGTDAPPADPELEFARGHYEQHMRVHGRVAIDGTAIDIEGFGLRDHSWGPRSWQALAYYRWLNCTFAPGFGIMVSEIGLRHGPVVRTGVLVRDGALRRITGVALTTDFAPGTTYQERLAAVLTLEDGEVLELQGRVTGFIPLRNRRHGALTQIGEGMTEYRIEGAMGLGISEYLDQVG